MAKLGALDRYGLSFADYGFLVLYPTHIHLEGL
jgi:hypothetical protein